MNRFGHMIELFQLDQLDAVRNKELIALLEATQPSAHPDLVEMILHVATPALGDFQIICPDAVKCRYVVLSTKGIGFVLLRGMGWISIKLPPRFFERALVTGATAEPRLGTGWVTIDVGRADWPAPDLHFWLLKAYAGIREANDA
jgi:hypothetical protein